jgi:FkbM family methyltransferase
VRVFVDVGGHYGETLAVALNPKWGFDRVYSLEPSAACLRVLSKFRDPRLVIEPIALSNRTGSAILYGSGLLGGSVYANKRQKADKLEQETIRLVRASDWLSTVPDGEIFLKLNCEGSEVDILENLLDTGMISRIRSIYVDFDIRKVEGQERRQQEIEGRMNGVRYVSPDILGCNANEAVSAWLERDCPTIPVSAAKRLSHQLRGYAPPYDRFVTIVGYIMPRRLFWWLGRHFGRLRRSRPSGSQSQ